MNAPDPPHPSRSGSRDQLSELVVRCLERMEKEGTKAIESVCAEHPEHADALRAQLENLARMGLLDDPESDAPEAEMPERLGEFRLLRRLGGGGMGVVYLAEQESLKREVALKLIRPEHLYFPKARARFVREIEAIARLSHPGIVRVYAAGEANKIPYFAMEVLDGASLQHVLDALAGQDPRALAGRDLARLVLGATADDARVAAHAWAGKTWIGAALTIVREVGEALVHAHAHDITHRDIKPSNVMLTTDGRAVLLDFGLATTSGASRLTVTGSVLGSVYSMAPEQISGAGESVDARTDVWGLGVLLYELLTLRMPFPGDDVESVRHRILLEEPASPREANPAVSWDAETVCLAALEKDPARRYASMAAFVRDVKNVLDLRPIEARRASAPRRLVRWMQRHKARAFAAALAFVTLVLAPLVVTIVVVSKNSEITAERDAALAAKREADVRAVEMEQVFEFQKTMLTSVQPGEQGREVKVASVLDDASQTVGSAFPGRPRVEAAVRSLLGETWLALGEYVEAEPHLVRAVELYEEAGEGNVPNAWVAMARLGSLRVEQGKLAEAQALLARAVESLAASGGRADALASVRMELANVCRLQGNYAEAETHARRALDALIEVRGESDRLTLGARGILVQLVYHGGDYERAEEESRKLVDAKSAAPALGYEHPETLISRQTLSVILDANGKPDEAVEVSRAVAESQERQLGEDHADLLTTLNTMATFLERAGKSDESGPIRRRVLETRRRTLGNDHPDTIRATGNLAHHHLERGEAAAARPLAEQALERAERVLGAKHVDTLAAVSRMGTVLRGEGKPEEALQWFTRAADGAAETLGIDHPTACEFRLNLARCLAKLGRYEEAEAQVLAVHEALKKRFGSDGRRTQDAIRAVVDVYTAWGKKDEAERWQARSVKRD